MIAIITEYRLTKSGRAKVVQKRAMLFDRDTDGREMTPQDIAESARHATGHLGFFEGEIYAEFTGEIVHTFSTEPHCIESAKELGVPVTITKENRVARSA